MAILGRLSKHIYVAKLIKNLNIVLINVSRQEVFEALLSALFVFLGRLEKLREGKVDSQFTLSMKNIVVTDGV